MLCRTARGRAVYVKHRSALQRASSLGGVYRVGSIAIDQYALNFTM